MHGPLDASPARPFAPATASERARQPDASADDPWMAAMRRGDFEAAWRISDRVLAARARPGDERWRVPRHLQQVWTGAALDGRDVLVRCYHGLGDTIQFARFAAPLRARARRVTYWVQPALLGLIATAPGVDRVLALHDGAPEVDYEVDIESMEVPHALRIRLADLSRSVPYLFPRRAAAPLAAGGLHVGLVWEAGGWDPRRSVPPALLAPLAALPNVRLYALQPDADSGGLAALAATDLAAADVEQAAARVLQLDLVITVDTMMAHLAGALGVRTWTLLHAACDWRWMRPRTDSPWYPSMRLFRQPEPGCWEPVVDAVRTELAALAHRRAPAASDRN